MIDNPYAAPGAAVRDIWRPAGLVRLYSPVQVACGTIGGPVGLIYFLRANFVALGKDHLARRTAWLGVLLIVALLVSVPLLPEDFPNSPFTIGYIVVALYVARKHQKTKQAIRESAELDFHSNWRVLGIGLLCFLVSLVAIAGPLFLLAYLGILTV